MSVRDMQLRGRGWLSVSQQNDQSKQQDSEKENLVDDSRLASEQQARERPNLDQSGHQQDCAAAFGTRH